MDEFRQMFSDTLQVIILGSVFSFILVKLFELGFVTGLQVYSFRFSLAFLSIVAIFFIPSIKLFLAWFLAGAFAIYISILPAGEALFLSILLILGGVVSLGRDIRLDYFAVVVVSLLLFATFYPPLPSQSESELTSESLCTPNWSCQEWSNCTKFNSTIGQQYGLCTDLNHCSTPKNGTKFCELNYAQLLTVISEDDPPEEIPVTSWNSLNKSCLAYEVSGSTEQVEYRRSCGEDYCDNQSKEYDDLICDERRDEKILDCLCKLRNV